MQFKFSQSYVFLRFTSYVFEKSSRNKIQTNNRETIISIIQKFFECDRSFLTKT